MPFPRDTDTNVLRCHLQQSLAGYFEADVRIEKITRRLSDYRSSFAIEELEVDLNSGRTLRIVFKDTSSEAMLADASRTKPGFLLNPARELKVYETILDHSLLGTPICYGTVLEPEQNRYWLFIEFVEGQQLHKIGDFETWLLTAEWLAGMHQTMAVKLPTSTNKSFLLSYDHDYYWRWMSRARDIVGRSRAGTDSRAVAKIEWLAKAYDQVVDRLLAEPITIIHGELYASNVVVAGCNGQQRVCTVDWETAALGPGLIDLAALSAGNWSDAERERLAQSYYRVLDTKRFDFNDFMTMLKYCHLHLSVLWIGWATEWYPPPEHAYDWLKEAMRLAEELDL